MIILMYNLFYAMCFSQVNGLYDITLFYDIVILLTSCLQKDPITCNHFKLQHIDPCLFGCDFVLFADWLLVWRNLLTPSILKIAASGLNVCK